MRYLALACDYDGTLAQDGGVPETTVAALDKLRGTGRQLLLVTGRELDQLLTIFPRVDMFERVVAENGALLYHPATGTTRTLAPPPPDAFIDALRRRHHVPISIGHVIVATWKPHEAAVLQAIRDLGLDLQLIFNKDAVMVLPSGVNKATGLTAALKELELSPHEVVAVGDAENDHALLNMCECGVAVRNALPSLKEHADLVTRGDHGAGVEELIAAMIDNDLRHLQERPSRHALLLGTRDDGAQERLAPFGHNLLIAGAPSGDRLVVATHFLESLRAQRYQFCLLDPAGQYLGREGAVALGHGQRAPSVDEILQVVRSPKANVIAGLSALPAAEQPAFCATLLPRLQQLRARTGRPHWLVVDDAHQLLPAATNAGPHAEHAFERTAFITEHPERLSASALAAVSVVVLFGAEPARTMGQYCAAAGVTPPAVDDTPLGPGEVLVWTRASHRPPVRVALTSFKEPHTK